MIKLNKKVEKKTNEERKINPNYLHSHSVKHKSKLHTLLAQNLSLSVSFCYQYCCDVRSFLLKKKYLNLCFFLLQISSSCIAVVIWFFSRINVWKIFAFNPLMETISFRFFFFFWYFACYSIYISVKESMWKYVSVKKVCAFIICEFTESE